MWCQLRMRLLCILAAFVLFLSIMPGRPFAQDIGLGTTQFEWCSQSDASFKEGFCLGYIGGLRAMNQVRTYINPKDALFCTPEGLSNERARAVVLKYLLTNPDKLNAHFSMIVILALREAFPCSG